MSSKQRTAPTPFGDVDFETVTCDSCDNEVAKKDAKRFVIGEPPRERDRYGSQQFTFDDGEWIAGWACPYCAEEGPLEFPGGSYVMSFLSGKGTPDVAFFIAMVLTGLLGGLALLLEVLL